MSLLGRPGQAAFDNRERTPDRDVDSAGAGALEQLRAQVDAELGDALDADRYRWGQS